MYPSCSFCGAMPPVAWYEGPDFVKSVPSARELAEDGVPGDEATALLDLIERELFPPVDLDEVLRNMKARGALPD